VSRTSSDQLVLRRTQPTAETIVRLTVTAVFAYLISLTVPGTSHSVLAPLIALLVAQVSQPAGLVTEHPEQGGVVSYQQRVDRGHAACPQAVLWAERGQPPAAASSST